VQRAQGIKMRIDRYERISLKRRVMTDGSSEYLDEVGETYDGELQGLKESFYETVERLESTGAILRDVDAGIVDFYTRFEGRDVFLCWRLGERKVRFWHEEEEEAAGRKRIIEVK